ncbi:TetR/AcrR family transcriptional regulator [Paenibacillus sp. M1]|uniref:TetR/AcrR family transcriptional regulator n=1 Tax=Paenibacillus haidiansis TaxID=1574488 RepID=A0ABU7VWY7_9BACL
MKEKPYHHGNLRNELIEAGIELINEVGLRDFSLRKVATKCNVSHAAPYSHFKNIDELVGAMGEHVTERFMDKLRASIRGREDSREAVSLLGQAYIEFFMEHPAFALFRKTAYRMFRRMGQPESGDSQRLIALWSMVHGIASLLTNPGVRYSGDWREVFIKRLEAKEREV